MLRGRFFRPWGRRSYKPSEVVGLFLLSIFAGMFVSVVAVAVDYLLRTFFG